MQSQQQFRLPVQVKIKFVVLWFGHLKREERGWGWGHVWLGGASCMLHVRGDIAENFVFYLASSEITVLQT